MSCSCTGNTKTCNCQKCRGIRLSQFPAINNIASSNQFVLASNKLIDYGTLLNSIIASIPTPEEPLEVFVEVTNAQSPYQMTGLEDVIFCTGIVEVLMIDIDQATKSFIVNADGGTVTITPTASDTVQTGVITDGNSGKFGPKDSTNQWRDL